MKLLVTGGAGFVGSHLTMRLLEAGYELVILERPEANVRDLPEQATVVTEDLRGKPERAAEILGDNSPEAIVHLAALVRANPEDEWVDQIMQTNVVLGSYLLAGASKAGVRAFVSAGTYWDSPREAGVYEPVNLYAASKRAFSDILHYYQNRQGLNSVELKLFGNYGPGDRRRNLFSALREAAGSTEPSAMTEGIQRVDIIHIDDLCSAFLASLEASLAGQLEGFRSYEIGTGTVASVREIAGWYEEGRGVPLNLKWGAKEGPTHPERAASIGRAETELNWKPRITIEAGVKALGRNDAGE